MDPEDLLAQEREKIFGLYGQAGSFYDNPESQALMAQLQGRAAGTTSPFGADVTSGMYAANADASAGRVAGEQDMIRRAFSNAGMGGSGLQAQAMIQSRRKANAATRTGRREITSRAHLENFQARERAQQQVQNFLAQKQQSMQAAQFAEASARGQQHATGDATNVAQVSTPLGQPGPTGPSGSATVQADRGDDAMRKRFMGANPFASGGMWGGRPTEQQFGLGGTSSMGLNSGGDRMARGQYNQAVKSWEQSQQTRQRQADDWSRQQANFFSTYGF